MAELRLIAPVEPRAALERLRGEKLNFDPTALARLRADPGWYVDHYRVPLPPERPGDPRPGGSWWIARSLSSAYEFVDPRILRAFYDPAERFAGRPMLLDIHFWGLHVIAGVRVGEEFDGYRHEGGRSARVWAWNYRTLSGHFEKGQIDYEVRKWLDSGEVEFRIDAVSRRADAGNPLVNLGFLIFGRRKQKQFARNACKRMAELTESVLDGELDQPSPRPTRGLTVRPGLDHTARPHSTGRRG